MSTVTLASLDVMSAYRALAVAAFTALGYTPVVVAKVREGQASPYAKIGEPFEVVDGGDFSDGDGFATRVTMPMTFYSADPPQHYQLAATYAALVTGAVTIPGFNVYLHHDLTAIPTTETDTDGPDVYGAIVDAVLTLEPT